MTASRTRAPVSGKSGKSAAAPEPVTPAAVLALLAGIERHGPGAPAALAFRSALRRKGQDLAEAGGPTALADMLAWIRAADPDRADARETVITAAWAGLPPQPGGA